MTELSANCGLNQTPEEEATSECGNGSGTNTDGR